MNYFKGKQFQKDVIIVAVGYYLRYNLSYREIQELLYDRGINVCHTTIFRWVQEYSKMLVAFLPEIRNKVEEQLVGENPEDLLDAIHKLLRRQRPQRLRPRRR